jgi:DNA polymerase I
LLQSVEEGPGLAKRLQELTAPTSELEEGLLVSATYDGDKRKAVLKFYDSRKERVWLWEDNTGHRPYCYTRLTEAEIASAGVVVGKNGVVAIEPAVRRDLLSDSEVVVRKITASDPLAIGGSPGSLRERIECWEADIKYFENYVYDRGLKVGTYYKITHGELAPVEKEVAEEVRRSLDSILARATGDAAGYIKAWAELLGQPLATFKRVACDIEVANEENRIPDPEIADREVIAVSFYNDKESIVYMIDKTGHDKSLEGALTGYSHTVFPDEASLLRATFSKMMEYPFLITFNGDDFDLRYLKHRAMRKEIGIREEEIPIALQRQEASLKHGVHIDLYRFFNNKSIQVYVYNNRYSEHTLNGIAEALLGKEKFSFEGNIAELPLVKLADYCLNDSSLTYELTSANDSLLMKILLVIARIAKMPMNDAARLGVSNWIRSMLFYDHRRVGALIPRTDELKQKGGASSEATIKGKKYKGGLVIEPKPGIYFGVSVLDFASLYPSIIKVHNLSYETVNCIHEECRSNRVPDTEHWICRRRSGIESLLIGSLRDLRVGHYKVLAKDKTLPKESKDLYSTVTQGLKIILNASYGVMGFETFALYCLPVADATAALGRDAITRTIEKCKQEGVSVIYSDSVTAERCVTVMDPAGHVKVIPIEEFFELFEDVLVRPDGKEEVHPIGWKTLSTSIETGVTDWKEVKAAIRHRNEKKVFRVWDKFGSTRVTEDHSLVVGCAGVRLLSSPQELQGKHLLRISRFPEGGKTELIDTFKVLEPIRYRVSYKGRWKTLEAHCDDSSVWYSWTKRTKPIRLKRFIAMGSPEFRALVELLGAYIPEGSSSTPDTTKSRIGASIACSDTQWLAKQQQNYYSLFSNAKASIIESNPGVRDLTYVSTSGKTMQIQYQYQDKTHKLQMMNKLSAVFFKAFCGQKSFGKHLPDLIFDAPEEFKRTMLENLIKGDGSRKFGKAYSPEYRLKNFRYESKSLRLISGLSTLLMQLGINHTVGFRPSKRTYAIATSTKHNQNMRSPRTIEESYEGYVYDLSVDGYHTFTDSCGSVVLKNTDSLFIENPNKEKVSDVLKWADKELGVELEVDKTYRYVAFSQLKKNYFGVLQDGTADIKGLTGKKSQTPEFLKREFYEMLDILVNVYSQDDFVQAKARIKKLLTDMVASLKERKIPIEDLSFNVMMGKSISGYRSTKGPEPMQKEFHRREEQSFLHERPENSQEVGISAASMSGLPQHVKAAILLRNSNREVKAGELISFVKTKGGHGVKPTMQAKPEDIDVEKYIEYASSMFDQVLGALDLSFESVVPKTSLDAFWS